MRKLLLAIFSLAAISKFFLLQKKKVFATAISGRSLLWEISGKNLRRPSYFFGTMHLMCAEDTELSKNVQLLVKRIGQVYLEADMNNASEILTGFTESNNTNSLSQALSVEDYLKVKDFFGAIQQAIPFSVLEQQPPLMILSSLYEFLLPCEQKNGVDIKIIEEASKANKPVYGLETIAFQLNVFNSIPYADQAHELVKVIDNLEKHQENMQQMVAVYKEQDIEKLYILSENDEGIVSSYLDVFLFNRNHNWANIFPSIAKKSPTLFAVGAGHLGGDKGVLNLLKNQGYTVRPIEN